MATKIINVSQLKSTIASLLNELEVDRTPYYVVQHGKPRAVLVGYEDYEALLRHVEDLEDALVMHEAMSSPPGESVSLEEHEPRQTTEVRG